MLSRVNVGQHRYLIRKISWHYGSPMKNLYDTIPVSLPEEAFEVFLEMSGCTIKRIVSRGHRSPDGFWFDQECHEWVTLLQGSATLRFEGELSFTMEAGDCLNIPAHTRHRIESTDVDQDTIWLAVYYPNTD